MLVGLGGREADAAIAHDDGGDAVPGRGRHFLVPSGLAVIVRVDVDPAGRNDLAGGVDFLLAGANLAADGADQPAIDRNIADITLAARAIDKCAAANDQIMHRLAPCGLP